MISIIVTSLTFFSVALVSPVEAHSKLTFRSKTDISDQYIHLTILLTSPIVFLLYFKNG